MQFSLIPRQFICLAIVAFVCMLAVRAPNPPNYHLYTSTVDGHDTEPMLIPHGRRPDETFTVGNKVIVRYGNDYAWSTQRRLAKINSMNTNHMLRELAQIIVEINDHRRGRGSGTPEMELGKILKERLHVGLHNSEWWHDLSGTESDYLQAKNAVQRLYSQIDAHSTPISHSDFRIFGDYLESKFPQRFWGSFILAEPRRP